MAVVVLIAYVLTRGITDQIMQNVADGLAEISSQTARPAEVQDLPPVGQAWFGSTFDPNTLELRGRTTTVGTNEPFAMVAHLSEAIDGSQMSIRVYLDDQLINTQSANAEGNGDTWGWSLGPLFEPGVWRYEITDVGGNVLAAGELTATAE